MLYEQVDLKTLSQKEFSEVIYRADELIMKPFTRYRKDFSDDIQEKTTMIPIALLRSLRLVRLFHARSRQMKLSHLLGIMLNSSFAPNILRKIAPGVG